MNQSYFLIPDFDKVTAEFSLSVLAYNIKCVLNIIGVKELIEIMRNIAEKTLFYFYKLFFRQFRTMKIKDVDLIKCLQKFPSHTSMD